MLIAVLRNRKSGGVFQFPFDLLHCEDHRFVFLTCYLPPKVYSIKNYEILKIEEKL